MANGRPSSTTAPTNDDAVILPVSVLLILAAAVTVYAQAAQVLVPAWGGDAEEAWDGEIAASFFNMRGLMHANIATLSPTTGSVPSAPQPRSLEVLFLGKTTPFHAEGTLTFEPNCGRWDATHTVAGATIVDVAGGSRGCVAFQAGTIYTTPYAYRIEHGGVVRIQGDGAVVLAGPPLDIERASPSHLRASLSLASLLGNGGSRSGGGADTVEFSPLATTQDTGGAPNAERLLWTLDTFSPAAWKSWFDATFESAGLVAMRASPGPGESAADYAVACEPADCSVGPDGMGRVAVSVEGPRTDVRDIDLALAYGTYDVQVG